MPILFGNFMFFYLEFHITPTNLSFSLIFHFDLLKNYSGQASSSDNKTSLSTEGVKITKRKKEKKITLH